jgi:hypothetical protein
MDVGTADPAGADLDEDVVRTADRIGHVHIGHLLIFGEEQGFHRRRGRRVLAGGARLGRIQRGKGQGQGHGQGSIPRGTDRNRSRSNFQ